MNSSDRKLVLFQHDGALCHNAKRIKEILAEKTIEILGLWPGNSSDLNPIENLLAILKKRVDHQKQKKMSLKHSYNKNGGLSR